MDSSHEAYCLALLFMFAFPAAELVRLEALRHIREHVRDALQTYSCRCGNSDLLTVSGFGEAAAGLSWL